MTDIVDGNSHATEEAINAAFKVGELSTEITELKRQVDYLSATAVEAEKRAETYRADFDRLNVFLNEYANDKRMCSDYESTLEEWNNSFSLLKLVGRLRDYRVQVSVTVCYSGVITVEALNETEAQREVRAWDSSEVLSEIEQQDSYPSVDFDTNGVETDEPPF